MQEFELLVVVDGKEFTETWFGNTFEQAAQRLLDCKYLGGKVIAWRYPSHVVTTTPMRGTNAR